MTCRSRLVADCRLIGIDETLIRDGSDEDLERHYQRALRDLMRAPSRCR